MGTPGLTAETFTAARQTAAALPEAALYILRERELDYLLLGLIQSDYLEGRFGWYRQLCGANYFNSVLQFLQAEKKIRMLSLIRMGFSISDIQGLRNEEDLVCTEGVAATVKKLYDCIDVSMSDVLQGSPEHIIYYVCGALAHSVLRANKCSDCVPLISPGKQQLRREDIELDESETDEDSEQEASLREELVHSINRGGLLKPSDVLYVSCHHIWGFYKCIRKHSEWSKLLMESEHPLSVFISLVTEKLEDSENTDAIMRMECRSGHQFSSIIKKMTKKMFNTMCKNYVSEQNSKIHASRKRETAESNPKQSADSRKIKKLRSYSFV